MDLVRLRPDISVSESGAVTWQATIVDYDADLYYRGKTVTHDEYNKLFIQQATQGNYTADSLQEFFKTYLNTAIYRQVVNTFNLHESFSKVFSASDWEAAQEEGYYQIVIPASEHGLESLGQDTQINVDVEMYVLSNGEFYTVELYAVDDDNTVTLYTDDNTLTGFVVIRSNDKAVTITQGTIEATQVSGLATVARTGAYSDLAGLTGPTGPNTRLTNLEENISDIISGDISVGKAVLADNATDAVNVNSTIGNIPLENIFETGSSVVKHATLADTATNANHATTADGATNANQADTALFADTQSYTDNSEKIANTEFTHNLVNTLRTTYKRTAGNPNDADKGSSGYLKLDNGIMLKWGFVATPSGAQTVNVIFDSTVPFGTLFIVLITPYSNSNTENIWVTSKTTTGFTYKTESDRTDCLYLAIGI